MKQGIQWGLCGFLSAFTLTGIVVTLIGALNYNPPNVVMIISGTLIVAVCSFALTLLAKVLTNDGYYVRVA